MKIKIPNYTDERIYLKSLFSIFNILTNINLSDKEILFLIELNLCKGRLTTKSRKMIRNNLNVTAPYLNIYLNRLIDKKIITSEDNKTFILKSPFNINTDDRDNLTFQFEIGFLND